MGPVQGIVGFDSIPIAGATWDGKVAKEEGEAMREDEQKEKVTVDPVGEPKIGALRPRASETPRITGRNCGFELSVIVSGLEQ